MPAYDKADLERRMAGAVDSLKWKKGDLLCLGSSPMGPIARVFIGSTATELLPHVRVPVLVSPTSTPDTAAAD